MSDSDSSNLCHTKSNTQRICVFDFKEGQELDTEHAAPDHVKWRIVVARTEIGAARGAGCGGRREPTVR